MISLAYHITTKAYTDIYTLLNKYLHTTEHKAEQDIQKEKKLQHHASERVMRLRQIEENEQGREKEKQLKIMQVSARHPDIFG